MLIKKVLMYLNAKEKKCINKKNSKNPKIKPGLGKVS